MLRRIFAPILTFILIVGVGAAIYMSASEQFNTMNVEQAKGLSGSEKLPFFQDQRTAKALAKSPHQIAAEVEKAGSRQIATSYNLSQYDFAFPAGIHAAEKIKRESNIRTSFQPFFTPMVIASWRPIADILIKNQIVKKRDNVFYITDMAKLFQLIINKTRWKELKGSDKYPANKTVLITTTDIRKSNSAAMYLAIASYVLNNNNIVQNDNQAKAIINQLASLFMRQGFTENSSAVPFQDYLVMGPGKTPMVMIYESQFLHEAAKVDSAINDDMVLLYPEPTLFTKHVLVPFNDKGTRLGEALKNDETLQKIATEYGLRTDNIKLFKNFIKTSKLSVPSSLVNVIDAPTFEVLENMIQMIELQYNHNI